MTEAVYKKELIALANGEVVQAKYKNSENSDYWFDIVENPTAMTQLVSGVERHSYEMDIRIKPKTHIVCGHEIYAPETEMPADGTEYFIPEAKDVDCDIFTVSGDGDYMDWRCLKSGIMYITEEDAIAHSKAWANPK